jgi:predicted glycoside hydrolase/deacetylase ChbG (UPF0249 family)
MTALTLARTVAICADDYGLSESVDRGILRLAAAGRLSAVSCLANGPNWAEAAARLAAVQAAAPGGLSVGLHFNLTEGRPLSSFLARRWPQLPSLPRLLLLSHLRLLPVAALRDELRAQREAFSAAFGRAPGHLDGHQHVHHLPGVSRIVLALADEEGLPVRNTGQIVGPGHAFKRWVIGATGGSRLGRQLRALELSANTTLAGVYDFDATDYRALVQRWLAALPPQGGMLFCHPGETAFSETKGQRLADPIASARARELDYLSSDAFIADLRSAGASIVRPA